LGPFVSLSYLTTSLATSLACRDGACPVSAARDAESRVSTGNSDLRIRGYVVLHLKFVEHIEIGVQLVVLLQRLQIADGGSRLNRQAERRRVCLNGFHLIQ